MVTYMKNNGNGIYITEEQGANISGNTPGNIDLDQLTEGRDYIYLDDIKSFSYMGSCNVEGDSFEGFSTFGRGLGQVSVNNGTAIRGRVLVSAIGTETQSDFLLECFKKHAGTLTGWYGSNQKYLVYQKDTSNWKHFYNGAGTQKNYCPIIVRQLQEEIQEGQFDSQMLQFACEEVWSS